MVITKRHAIGLRKQYMRELELARKAFQTALIGFKRVSHSTNSKRFLKSVQQIYCQRMKNFSVGYMPEPNKLLLYPINIIQDSKRSNIQFFELQVLVISKNDFYAISYNKWKVSAHVLDRMFPLTASGELESSMRTTKSIGDLLRIVLSQAFSRSDGNGILKTDTTRLNGRHIVLEHNGALFGHFPVQKEESVDVIKTFIPSGSYYTNVRNLMEGSFPNLKIA